MALASESGREVEEIIRILSMYGAVPRDQFLKLFPEEGKIDSLLWRLWKMRRVHISPTGIVSAEEEGEPNRDRLTALWVLVDFIDRAIYHCVGEFPVQLSFFATGEVYEVVVVHIGQEALIDHAFWCQRGDIPPRRIVVVDQKGQVERLHIQNTAAYCTVNEEGQVEYFKEVNGEDE